MSAFVCNVVFNEREKLKFSDNDLQKFIQTFPGMYRELRSLELNINPQNGNISGADTPSTGPPAPEPTAILLFGTGIAGPVGSRIRRKK